jgi:hypothetical protein
MYYECRHIMPNGARCHSPSLKGAHFCYFHTRLHHLANAPAPSADQPLKLPILEDRSAIQVALSQILGALGSEKLDPRRAGLFLYGLQIASQNVERNMGVIATKTVESITHTREGDELAPERQVCYSGDPCSTCPDRDVCDLCEPDEEEEEDAEEE